jgi:crotonobetainyl-CoA:carnitine CoA-transferase CaiB-like acyl-CoA transferase
VASPVRIRGETAPLGPAPRLGEHTEEVLGEAGLSADDIAALRSAGVLRP